jgi:hypothetical protein
MSRRPLPRDTLHEIGTRRRKDRDVRALLWEIKRLRDLVATIASNLAELRHEESTHRDYFHGRLEDLLEAERAGFDPKTCKPARLHGGKPEREPVTGHAQNRRARIEAEEREQSEREAKRKARQERG